MKRFIVRCGEEENLRTLHVDETAYVCVYANQLWNDSGIDVGWGERYTFRVPNGEKWINGGQICGADGYPSTWLKRPWECLRRVPEAHWFKLIGAIGRSVKSRIIVGEGLSDLLAPSAGHLYFFANDLPWMYWNNKGQIPLRITRTR
jgi:hypothetical protein